MIKVAGVRFKNAGKVYYFDPDQLEVKLHDNVIVETARGLEFGTVTMEVTEVRDEDVVQPLKKIIRIAGAEDIKHHEENEKKKLDYQNSALNKLSVAVSKQPNNG